MNFGIIIAGIQQRINRLAFFLLGVYLYSYTAKSDSEPKVKAYYEFNLEVK